jgi:outer membrane lipoprotein SlyB
MDQTVPVSAATTSSAASLPRWVWLAGGGALLLISGLASALVFRGKSTEVPAEQTVAAVSPKPDKSTLAVGKPAAKAAHEDSTCKGCGVVESVTPVTKKGQGTGAGAVVGGVLGGVVGHQMGGGTGKDAMTVIGAIGGGVAGNEVEKRARAETVYQVQLRMDDGSKRTLTLPSAQVAKGDRVAVEGQNLRRVTGDGAKASS